MPALVPRIAGRYRPGDQYSSINHPMKPVHSLLLLLLVALAVEGASAQDRFKPRVPLRAPGARGVPGEVLVKITPAAFARHASTEMFGAAADRYGISGIAPWLPAKLLETPPQLKQAAGRTPAEDPARSIMRIMKVRYSSADAPEDVARALALLPDVEYAEVVPVRELLYTPNDPLLSQQYYLDAIRAKEAWDILRADNSMIIAVVDAGVDRTHSDLSAAIWRNPGESGTDGQGNDKGTNGVDDDGNGYVDDWCGWDFAGSDGAGGDNNPSGVSEPHGTHVAGIAAASGNNNNGIAGVAFGATIMPLKATDDRGDSFYNEMEAILYAAKMGAGVINCSWGGTTSSRAEQEVLHLVTHTMGVVVVAAAGNHGLDEKYYPASYSGVISVAALTSGDNLWNSSNYNYRVDLAAPGVNLLSTVFSNNYDMMSGTSMASPVVSGAAALLRKRYPALSVEQVRELLRATADDLSATVPFPQIEQIGTGRVNLRRALETDPTAISSARMAEYAIVETDGDGVINAGETVRIRIDVRNILGNASSVSARLSIPSPVGIAVTAPLMNFGAMLSGETRSSADSVFTFTVPVNVEPNTMLTLKIVVATPDRQNSEYITLAVSPTYLTTDLNDIITTFNSVGNIAFNGTNRDQGDGFNYLGHENLLFHGGLMIGADPQHLADVVRTGGSSSVPADGFRAIQPYRLFTSPDSSVQIGQARFSDAHLGASGLGIHVTEESYEYRAEGSSNILLVVYRIRNLNTTPLSGMRCALFLDWDVSSSGFDDQTGFDPAYKLGYARDATGTASLYTGAALLTPQTAGYYAVNASTDLGDQNFSAAKKWMMMSSGIHENSSIDDMAMVIGTGAIDLAPGATAEVSFALVAAEDFAGLREAAVRAGELLTHSSAPAPSGSTRGLAADVTPNPFGASATIAVEIPAAGDAAVEIYDIRGAKVATLFDGRLDAGRHSFTLAGNDLPDGIYIYEVRAGGQTARGKIVRIRR